MNYFTRIKNNRGQGLLEALVAIFIILGAVISTLTLVISSINAGRISTDKLVASSLAREGIEVVRNIRDSNWLDEDEVWHEGILDPIAPASLPAAIPIVDETSTGLDFTPSDFDEECITDKGDCTRIYKSGSLYIQKSDPTDLEPTKFYRLLYINRICWSDTEDEKIVPKDSLNNCYDQFGGTYSEVGVRIISEVRWPNSGSNSNVIIEERIYDWRL